MKLYIDEDLTPTLVGIGQLRGYESTCVRDRGLLGNKDPVHFRLCQTEDRVFVTNNTDDFTGQCEAAGLHPGLITMPNHLTAPEQRHLLNLVIDAIHRAAIEAGESPAALMVNKHVSADEGMIVEIRELPST